MDSLGPQSKVYCVRFHGPTGWIGPLGTDQGPQYKPGPCKTNQGPAGQIWERLGPAGRTRAPLDESGTRGMNEGSAGLRASPSLLTIRGPTGPPDKRSTSYYQKLLRYDRVQVQLGTPNQTWAWTPKTDPGI